MELIYLMLFESLRKLKIFDVENKIYCNFCKSQQSGSRQEEIYSLPPILIIALNRGKNDQYFNEEFNFPEVLNLNDTNYVRKENSYKKYFLCGLIKYFGEDCSNSHYISYCRNSVNDKFVMYNDTLVSENIEINDAIKCKISDNNNENENPYILFYHFC